MKRGLAIFVFSVILISSVSAFSLSDLWKLTGFATKYIPYNITCVYSNTTIEGPNATQTDSYTKANLDLYNSKTGKYTSVSQYVDSCVKKKVGKVYQNFTKEAYCVKKTLKSGERRDSIKYETSKNYALCGDGCVDGACISSENQSNQTNQNQSQVTPITDEVTLTRLKNIEVIKDFLSKYNNSDIMVALVPYNAISSNQIKQIIFNTCLKTILPESDYYVVSTIRKTDNGGSAMGEGIAFISKEGMINECSGGKLTEINFNNLPTCNDFYISGDSKNRINIVFISDNFSAENTNIFLKEVGNISDYLFSIEPFKSNKNKFNIRYINYSGTFGCGISSVGSSWALNQPSKLCEGWIANLSSFCQYKNIVAVDIATPFNVGAPGIIPFDDKTMSLSFAGLFDHPDQENTFVHELGHALGSLADEYVAANLVENYWNNAPNCDTSGCSKWCSGKLNTANPCYSLYLSYLNCLKYCPEGINNCTDNCDVKYSNECYKKTGMYLGDQNFGISCINNTGCYPGCGSWLGFRSMKLDLMRSVDFRVNEFGIINEKALCQRIKNMTGSVEGICLNY